jgi:type VI secretion system protein ImpA
MIQSLPAHLVRLLAPVSATQPGGEDLEYSSDFLQLSKAAQPKSEQQYGSTVIPSEPADWSEVARLAEQMMTRSKDLRIATLLAQAWTEQRGLVGFAEALQLVDALMQQYWETLHPTLEHEGEYDPLPRHNALARLFDAQGCLLALRVSPLGIAGGLLLREIDQLIEGAAPECVEYPGGRERLRTELTQAWSAADPQLHALPVAQQALASIVRCVHTHFGDDWRPDTVALERLLDRLYGFAAESACAASATTALTAAAAEPVNPQPAIATNDWHALEVRSREDINLVLEKICVYLDRYEPSHPAPILLRRAQRLMHMGFYDILRDIAPDSLAQVDVFIGRPL